MKLYVGVDLGGTNIGAGVVDENGRILHKDEIPTGVGRPYQEIIKDMGDLIKKVIKNAGYVVDDIVSIGIGSPGVADKEKAFIVYANNLYWKHIPVGEELRKYVNLPVYIDNDANVAGLAEAVCGACQGYRNSVTITLGTGVGSGIIIDGKPYSGSHGAGAELGHMIVSVDGIECTCGNKGCFERYTSATALIREGKEAAKTHPESLIAKTVKGDLDKINAKVVIDAAKAGDEEGLKIFRRYIHYLTMGIITIINIFDPDIIAIGGGVSRAGDFLLDALNKEVEEHIFYKDLPHAKLCISELGNDAGIIGAAMLGKIN
ncbi:MAG: ROK family protein [Xylanivirga thermophila]|jgi:glucokinase|uniref:ROK family protein n=1 Tax=Xylanivirga thermophila TaxID=2496273 RepID=UPI00101D381D|nr:ROK family protein [Xylanivirga thermophila]